MAALGQHQLFYREMPGRLETARSGPCYAVPILASRVLWCGMTASWFSNNRLDAAYDWLCLRRKDNPANADIWWLRQRWETEMPALLRELATGRLRFEPLRQVKLKTGETIELWSARDALELKMLASALADVLPSSCRCTHPLHGRCADLGEDALEIA